VTEHPGLAIAKRHAEQARFHKPGPSVTETLDGQEVTLTPREWMQAVQVAAQRVVECIESGLQPDYWLDRKGRTWAERLVTDIQGVVGEVTVCKGRNRYFSPTVNTFHGVPDVDGNIEVRCTNLDNGSLIIRANDDPNRWYVLVTGEPPNMCIRGYIRGVDARRDEWLRNPNDHQPAWFVPQSALKQWKR
jgi:hypothetical protein